MSTIDERIVDMQFNNKQFEAGIKTSVQSLDDLKQGLKLEDSAKSLNALNEAGKRFSLGGIADGVRSISDAFSSMGIIGITTLANLTNSVVNGAKRMISALTIAPVTSGFSKFEEKTKAVQTIMNATGKDINFVNEQLKRLTWFSDETSYSFTDMVNSVGKFTAQNIKLEDAATAVQGISTWAALSGGGINEANRAMFNLSQAMSLGAVTRQDWISIQGANMATTEFKQTVIETAKAMGILSKANKLKDGTYVDDLTFGATLEKKWFTNDLLMKSLAKYGEYADEVYKVATEKGITAAEAMKLVSVETMVLGAKAFKASQEAKTFTEALNATKDAVSSGWMESFEIIFGNYEEAKVLWTEVAGILWDVFASGKEARNMLLEGWKELNGRTALIQGFRTSLEIVGSIVEKIRQAWSAVFPPATAMQLAQISFKFRKFMETLRPTEAQLWKVYEIFKGVFSVIKIGVDVVKMLVSGFIELLKRLVPVGGFLFDLTYKISLYITSVRGMIQESNLFNTVLEKFKGLLESVGGFFASMFDSIKKGLPLFSSFIDSITKTFNIVKTKLSEALGDSFQKDLFNGGLLAFVLVAINSFINNFDSIIDKFSGLITTMGKPFKQLSGLFKTVQDSLVQWQNNIKVTNILMIAGAIGILAIALSILSNIDPTKLAGALSAITVLFMELFGSILVFNKLSGGAKFKSLNKVTASMAALAVAVLILSYALKNLSGLDWEEMKLGLVGIGGILGALGLFMKFSEVNKIGINNGLGLVLLAAAVNLLAIAIGKFAKMTVKQIIKGIGTMGMALVAIGVFISTTGDAKRVITHAIGIAILAGALSILADALAKFAEMTVKQIIKGVGVLSASLLAIGIFMKATGSATKVITNAIAMVIIAKALLILGEALKFLGQFTVKEILKSIFMLAAMLTIIGVAMHFMSGAIPGALALYVVSAAITALTASLVILGQMTMKEMIKSMLMLAGVFVVIGLAGAILAPLIPVLFGLSAVMLLFGVAAMAVGAGVFLFATGLTALAASGAAAVGAIVLIIVSIAGLIPLVLTKLAEGLIAFADGIGNGADAIAKNIIKVVVAILNMLTTLIPMVLDGLSTFILAMIAKIDVMLPAIILAGVRMIISVVNGITSKLPELINAAFLLIISFINGLSEAIRANDEAIIDAVWNLIGAIIDAFNSFRLKLLDTGMTIVKNIITGLKDMMVGLWNEAVKIGKFLIDGFINGVKAQAGELWNAAVGVIGGAVDGVKKLLNMKSPSKVMFEVGEYFDLGLINGIKSLSGGVAKASIGVGTTATDAMKDAISRAIDLIDSESDFNPTITPVIDLSKVKNGLSNLDSQFGKKNISVVGTIDKAMSVAKNWGSAQTDTINTQTPVASQASTYVFNQTNISPKSLSRFEIYRQTRNQFSALKGLVENT